MLHIFYINTSQMHFILHPIKSLNIRLTQDFPGSPVIKTALPMQGTWVWSIVGESCMLPGTAKTKNKKNDSLMQNLITSSQLKRMSLLLQVTDNLCTDVAVRRQPIYQQPFTWWFWGSNDDHPCQNQLFQQYLLKFSNSVLSAFTDWYSVRKSFPSSAGTSLEAGSYSSLSLNYWFFKSQESPAVMTYDLVLHS